VCRHGSGGPGVTTVGGDISGDASSATVVAIQNRLVSSAAPAAGQGLIWDAVLSQWSRSGRSIRAYRTARHLQNPDDTRDRRGLYAIVAV